MFIILVNLISWGYFYCNIAMRWVDETVRRLDETLKGSHTSTLYIFEASIFFKNTFFAEQYIDGNRRDQQNVKDN